MTCASCQNGETGPGTTTSTLERNGTTLVVQKVPADVCDTCGEAYLTAETTDRLRELLDEAVRARVSVTVRDFVDDQNDDEKEHARGRVGVSGR